MRGEKQYAFSKTPIIRAALHERTVHSEYVYRFIPVDEDGNYLSEQGAYDIFLDFASKKKSPRFNFFIGRTYVLVFHIDNSRQLNERTLAAVYTG